MVSRCNWDSKESWRAEREGRRWRLMPRPLKGDEVSIRGGRLEKVGGERAEREELERFFRGGGGSFEDGS